MWSGADGRHHVVAEAQLVERAGPEVVHHRVRDRVEVPDDLRRTGRLEVHRDRSLAQVQLGEHGLLVVVSLGLAQHDRPDAGLVHPGAALDLDHVGAEQAQEHRAVGTGPGPGEIDDAHARQRPRHQERPRPPRLGQRPAARQRSQQRREDLGVVLPQRGGRAAAQRQVAEARRVARIAQRARDRVGDGREEAARLLLPGGQHLGRGQHGTGRDARRLRRVVDLGLAAAGHPLLHRRAEFRPDLRARARFAVVAEGPAGIAHQPQHRSPLMPLARDQEGEAVVALHHAIARVAVGVHGGSVDVDRRVDAVERRDRLHLRGVDQLAEPARRPLVQRRQGRDGGAQAGVGGEGVRGQRHGLVPPRPEAADEVARAGAGVRHGERGRRRAGLGSVEAERRHRHGEQRLRLAPPPHAPGQPRGPGGAFQVGQEDVGRVEQRLKQAEAQRRRDVQRHAALAGVVLQEGGRGLGRGDVGGEGGLAPRCVAGRRLDLDDVGAEAGEQLAREGGRRAPGARVAQLDDADAVDQRGVAGRRG